jgi:hypothetical protein
MTGMRPWIVAVRSFGAVAMLAQVGPGDEDPGTRNIYQHSRWHWGVRQLHWERDAADQGRPVAVLEG